MRNDPILRKVIDKAEALMRELNAFEESGDDLIEWFFAKQRELGTYDQLDADIRQWYETDYAEYQRLAEQGILID